MKIQQEMKVEDYQNMKIGEKVFKYGEEDKALTLNSKRIVKVLGEKLVPGYWLTSTKYAKYCVAELELA